MLKKILPALCMVILFSCNNNTQPVSTNFKSIDVKYPETKKDSTVKDGYFGTVVADPYRWLENDTSAETGTWVKAENEVTQNYLAQIPFRNAIEKRFENLFNYEKLIG